MMQLDFFFDLDHLPTARAEPVLLSQDCSTKRRRRMQRQLPVAVLEVRLPCGVERIGRALDLEVALRFDRLPHPEELLAGGRISESPRFLPCDGESSAPRSSARSCPGGGVGPAIHPPPDKGVQLGEGLATEDMAMIVRPAPQDGVEGIDELFWRGTPGLLTEGPDLGLEGLEAGLARSDLQLGRLPVGRSGLRTVCPKKSKPCARGVMTVFSVESRTPRSAKKALIRGRTTSANSCREVAVTMKSSAQRT